MHTTTDKAMERIALEDALRASKYNDKEIGDIVTAVNAHDELVECLKMFLDGTNDKDSGLFTARELAKSTLNKFKITL